MSEKIAFLAADTDSAQAALHELTEIYGPVSYTHLTLPTKA